MRTAPYIEPGQAHAVAINIILLGLLSGCGAFDTTYTLAREIKEPMTGTYLRLWHYSEGMLDPAGYNLEVVENKLSTQPNIGRTIVWVDGSYTLPTVKYDAGCYVLRATANHVVRFEQKNWLSSLFFGSGVDLRAGDTWNEEISQESICFRYEK